MVLGREGGRRPDWCSLFQIFVDNFVHGDLHPGNILVQGADGLFPSLDTQQQQVNVHDTLVTTIAPALCPLRLVLLDAGIVSELQASDLRNFRAVFLAVALGQVRLTGVGPLESPWLPGCCGWTRVSVCVGTDNVLVLRLGSLRLAPLVGKSFFFPALWDSSFSYSLS